ncbi:phage tail sheath protein FI [Pseudarthrobacter defluvii]|uniref:phage tail sheath family protein n=1 Tax=Pseudarthrobacter defluvii TaxID=410837 RepID=UPI00278A5995|nr:phage tail sheath subtilisin-like domain-containing protein [Pseudarthrobacter defluvii]MDQ0767278.1 phage tail sheath protein FI [Pseudarthrobacter defluvii]
MPVQLSYPGVYVEEIPSGVRTITGVATSIAAFVGWTPRGPVGAAGHIFGWGDYERRFGGLHRDSWVSYAVSHFFANGGQEAYIIRLADPEAGTAGAGVDDLRLTATGSGSWANDYGVDIRIREGTGTDADNPARFSLTVFRRDPNDSARQDLEVFADLSMAKDDARFVGSVVNEQSELVNAEDPADGTAISESIGLMLIDGTDGEVLQPGDPEFWAAAWPTDPDDDGRLGGVFHLDRVDLFNLLCVPGLTDLGNLELLAGFCRQRRAFLIADGEETINEGTVTPVSGDSGINAAIYYPWVRLADPKAQGRLRTFPPSGVVAGVYARTDTSRGVWKAPAGTDASLTGVRSLSNTLTDPESGTLNKKGVNALRTFSVYGNVVWGARTCRGNDEIGSEWKYVPVRRTALFIEESLRRSLKWVVFEPNDEPLWGQIRLNVGAFMNDQFRKGAFQGATRQEAYYVKCDKETTTQSDINLGIVNILVGFAPLKPAEFVVLKLQQMAGQVQA